MISLPYFDLLLEGRSRGDPASAVFNRFVHWGYWEAPSRATRDIEGFLAAMARLNEQVLTAAELADGQTLLDAGCGFGGTLSEVNGARRGMSLTGLNIDRRQLAVARAQVEPRNGNRLRWTLGDACALPFPDACLDRVLAVECIFHFPSRIGFLKEASRVLRPGGRLALSDFVPWNAARSASRVGRFIERQISKGYGAIGTGFADGDYAAMARKAGLEPVLDRDITAQTLPTYPILIDLLRKGGMEGPRGKMYWPTVLLEWLSRLRLVRYRVLSFRKAG